MSLQDGFSKILAIIKRNIWLAALWFAALFFALPVQTALVLQSLKWGLVSNGKEADFAATAAENLQTVFSTHSLSLTWILLLMAFVSALVFGAYMHKQRQVDFYHSQPPRRHVLLLQNTAAGLLSILLPYVANLLLAIIVAMAMGAGAAFPWGGLLWSLIVHTLYFTAIFATALIAVVLSGNGAVAAITGVFVLALGPSLLGLSLAMGSEFYPVFYSNLYDWGRIIRWLSPAAAYASVPLNGLPYGILPIIAYDALALLAALALYRKRGSEAAGQAIAFKPAQPLLKYAMAALAASVFALVFHSIGNYGGSNYFWWYFGAVTGAFLATQITEIVYAADFRAIIRNLRGLAVFLVVYLALATCAMNDVGRFNSAVPQANQVAKAEIFLTGVNNYTSNAWGYNYGYSYNGRNTDGEHAALQREEKDYLAQGPVTSPAAIAAAVNIAARYANAYLPEGERQPDVSEAQLAEWRQQGKQYLLDYVDEDYDSYTYGYINLNTTSCRVVFTLNNGRTIARDYRHISIPVQFMLEDIQTIYAEEDFAAAQLMELNFADECYLPDQLTIHELYSGAAPLPRLTMEQRQRLMSALRADLAELSVAEQQQQMPLGVLRLRQYASAAEYPDDFEMDARPCRCLSWPIYASCQRTLAFFAELGYGLELWQPQLKDIVSVSLFNRYDERYQKEKYGYADGGLPPAIPETTYGIFDSYATSQQIMATEETGTPITDPAAIAELVAASYPYEATEYNCFINIDQRAELEVTYRGAGGQTYVMRRVFPY